MQYSVWEFRIISYLFVLPAYKMNKWMPSFFFVFFLAVFFVKLADTGRKEDSAVYSDDGIINIHIFKIKD